MYDEAEGRALLGYVTLTVEIAAVVFAFLIGAQVDKKAIRRQVAVTGVPPTVIGSKYWKRKCEHLKNTIWIVGNV